MNMAALYAICNFENTLFNLDFQIHLILKHGTMQKWITRFNESNEFHKAAWKTLGEIKAKAKSLEIAQFQAVTKWFIHGLSGPFGVVSRVGTQNTARLGYPHVAFEDLSHPMNISPPPSSFAFVQSDSHNCGVCCLFFYGSSCDISNKVMETKCWSKWKPECLQWFGFSIITSICLWMAKWWLGCYGSKGYIENFVQFILQGIIDYDGEVEIAVFGVSRESVYRWGETRMGAGYIYMKTIGCIYTYHYAKEAWDEPYSISYWSRGVAR